MRIAICMVLLVSFFASCNQCKNVNCLNGGYCSDGNCQCISPYTGKNCEINSCQGVVCHNGGNCINGVCACASGYEGIHCDSIVTTKFTGNFSCVQQCAASSTYNVTVTASGPISASNITFYSLHGFEVVAVVNYYGINIQSQTIQTGQTVSGDGYLSTDGTTITLNMTITPAGSSTGTTCTYTLTRI